MIIKRNLQNRQKKKKLELNGFFCILHVYIYILRTRKCKYSIKTMIEHTIGRTV